MVQRDSDNNEGGHVQDPNERAKEQVKKVKLEENKEVPQAQGVKKKKKKAQAPEAKKKKEEEEKEAKKKKEEQEKEAKKKKEEQEQEAKKKKEEQEIEAKKKKEEQELQAKKKKEEQELQAKKQKNEQGKGQVKEEKKPNERKRANREKRKRKKKKAQEQAQRLGHGSSKENRDMNTFTEGPGPSNSHAEALIQPLSMNLGSTAISDSSTLSLADRKLGETSSGIGKPQDMDPVSDMQNPHLPVPSLHAEGHSLEPGKETAPDGLSGTPASPAAPLGDNTDLAGDPISFVRTNLIRPTLVGTFILNNKTKIEDCLRNASYEGAYLAQAGFSPDLLKIDLFHEEIVITLEEAYDLRSFGEPLLPLLHFFSVRVMSSSQEVWFPRTTNEGVPVSLPPALIITAQNGSPISDTNRSITGNGSQDNGDKKEVDKSTQPTDRGTEPTRNGDNHEMHVAEDQRNQSPPEDEKRSDRRKLLLPLVSSVKMRATNSINHPFYQFIIKPDIMIELSSNINGDDPPPDVDLIGPWYRFQVNNLFVSTNPKTMHCLRYMNTEANATPQNTRMHKLPSIEHGIVDGLKQKRETQRGGKVEFSLSKGPGVNLGFTTSLVTGSEPSHRRWKVHPDVFVQDDSVTVQSIYEHSSAYDSNGDSVYAENFEPGPYALFETDSETESRTLRIKFVAFWTMENSARGSKRSKLSPTTFFRLLNGREKDNEPLLFANFLHEMAFEVDLGKITATKAAASNPNLLDRVENLQEAVASPQQFPKKALDIKTPSGDKVDIDIEVERAVRGQIAGKNGRSFEAGSSIRSVGAASRVVV